MFSGLVFYLLLLGKCCGVGCESRTEARWGAHAGSSGNGYWFDVSEDASVQAGGNRTIRPALIRDGVPLLRGIIAGTASK